MGLSISEEDAPRHTVRWAIGARGRGWGGRQWEEEGEERGRAGSTALSPGT